MKSCTRCVTPETSESLTFDTQGVCSVCHQVEVKKTAVDWDARGPELDKVLDAHRGKSDYDCIVPFSGGKDSICLLRLAEKAFHPITTFTNPDGTKRPLAEADLRPLMRTNQFRFALVIPADLISPDAPGIRLKIYSNPRNEIETQTVNGLLQRTIFSSVPQLLGRSLQGAGDRRKAAQRYERSEERRVGKECRSRWSPYH